MNYAVRTCNICGIRKPQPEMVRAKKRVEVAQSKRALSGREVAGFVLGSKKSTKSVHNWMLAPNKRSYTSTREVWMCKSCAAAQPAISSSGGNTAAQWIGAIIGIIIVLFFLG